MHQPVLLNEVINYLNPKPGENFIDCTIGEAGHAVAILERIKPDGKILGIDVDLNSLKRIKPQDGLILVQGNFKDLKKITEKNNFYPVNGILFDLGLSSWQIEGSGRGFSFKKDEPLNMNFQSNARFAARRAGSLRQESRVIGPRAEAAAEIINKWPEKSLIEVFLQYGEERYSRRIARRIVEERKKQSIKTTFQLKDMIEKAIPYRRRADRVLARIFQSLRIVVNDELENLKQGIEQAAEILMPGGRLVVISFHSLEDRIVKNFFRPAADQLRQESRVIGPWAGRIKALTKKPVTPGEDEIKKNPRSRSAKLRAAEKLAS